MASSEADGKVAIKGFLPGALADVVDDADTGAFANDESYLQTLEALTTLQVMAYKLGQECQQRVVSFASRDFGDSTSSGVTRALESLPVVHQWVKRLKERLATRGALPCTDKKLPPRFVRTCDVYEFSEVERRIFAALLMMRSTHAFTTVKLTGSVGYGGSNSIYGSGSKPGVTLSAIIDVSLTDVSTFQKAERKHVKQGVLTPGVQLITELPALQSEAVLLLLALPLSESQLFNIEKSDLMKVLREEPGCTPRARSTHPHMRTPAAGTPACGRMHPLASCPPTGHAVGCCAMCSPSVVLMLPCASGASSRRDKAHSEEAPARRGAAFVRRPHV